MPRQKSYIRTKTGRPRIEATKTVNALAKSITKPRDGVSSEKGGIMVDNMHKWQVSIIDLMQIALP